jgi:hypothetical protein
MPSFRTKYWPLTLCLFVAAMPCLGQARDPLPVPDLAGFQTLKCDFHMHTVFSDGDVWPTIRVTEAWREGLDAIAITDHAGYNPHKADVSVDLKRPHALASPLAEQLGIILVPAVEVMEGDTHFNLLFVTDQNAFMGLSTMAAALRQGRAQDAFIFWNHPGWRKPKAEWFPPIDALYKEKLFDALELVNGRTYYPEAFPWIEEKSLTIISNSDTHAPTLPEYRDRGRPLTLVFAKTRDLAGIREALFARRTAAWMGGEVWGNEEYLRGLWQGAVSIESGTLAFRPDLRQVALELRNTSAIPFRFRVVNKPAWITAGSGELRPEGAVGLSIQINKQAPAGEQSVELELEVTNLHVAPGRNLSVRLPLNLKIGQ